MIDPERLTAFHEAGHALAAELFGEQTTRVEIVGDIDHSGSTETLRFPAGPDEVETPRETRESIESRLRCVLAGVVTEAMISGREGWDDASEDLEMAVRIAMKLVDDCEDVLPLLERTRLELERVLRERWPAVERLADELMHRKSLSGSEVRRILGLTESD